MSEAVPNLQTYRKQIADEAWAEGQRAGRRLEQVEARDRQRRLHKKRMLVHFRRFLQSLAVTLGFVGLLASHAVPQLHEFLVFVIGGAAVFTGLQAYRWDMHRDAYHRLEP